SYVPRVPPVALLGKVTATTFVLERPCCVFDRHANASDTVWLVVAFVNASATFRNPLARVDVPLYKQLPTASSYMTLETAVAAYACSAPSPDVLRVGADTACRDHGRQDHCNGPLPSPGPYSPSTIDPVPTHCSGGVVVITSILASLGTVLAATVLGALGAVAHPCHECGSSQHASPAALKHNKCSRGNEPNLFAVGLRLVQECGRLVTTGESHWDAEPNRLHSCPRHPGTSTMLPLLLLLLPVAHGVDKVKYTPALTKTPLKGLKTTSTFVLEQPRCVFGDYKNAVIWLVVATDKGASTFNNSVMPGTNETAYQGFPDPVPAYMTLNLTLANYACPKPKGEITVLRVGSETSCVGNETRPTCNGPLPGPGPYR
ncbi:PREDICTED: uncharacterized protein LOC103798847, partial [Acanthisitta chloris]|uniref:uncharacterized protein LOC103798847 n=1 Tax=Acanthisitta chloris TaxID=57068 RepID=UPI0004F0EB8F